MRSIFYLDEDHETIWGVKGFFKDKDNFVKEAIKHIVGLDDEKLTEEEYIVTNVDTEVFVSSANGLKGESFLQLKETDITIETCYVGDIEVQEKVTK
jgi:hypothetical protein